MAVEHSDASAFTILVVCSGNICRSPIGQQLLRARFAELGAGERFQVLSAGTIASRGHAMTDEAQEMSRRFGGRPDGHQSTPLSEKLVARSQLVLTATRDHRAAVASLLPRASRYAFTLNQFARLAASVEPGDLDAISDPLDRVAAIAARRGFAPPAAPEDDDTDDPYLEPIEVYERVAAEIDADTRAIAQALATSSTPSSGQGRREEQAPVSGPGPDNARPDNARPDNSPPERLFP